MRDKMQDFRPFRYVIVLKPNKKRHAWNYDLSTKTEEYILIYHHKHIYIYISGWWFGTFFPYIGNNGSN